MALPNRERAWGWDKVQKGTPRQCQTKIDSGLRMTLKVSSGEHNRPWEEGVGREKSCMV